MSYVLVWSVLVTVSSSVTLSISTNTLKCCYRYSEKCRKYVCGWLGFPLCCYVLLTFIGWHIHKEMNSVGAGSYVLLVSQSCVLCHVFAVVCLWCLQCFDAVLLVGQQEGHPACKTELCGAGMVICLEQGADLRMAQLMPLLLTISCFSKIQIGTGWPR